MEFLGSAVTTCIIQGRDEFDNSSFIRTHVELLDGPKVALTEYYPELTYQGRQIRYFYGQRPRLKKFKKLLPHWLYHRYVTQWEETYAGRHDAIAAFMLHHDVDVILAEFGIHGATICPHARDLGIPLVVHFHGHDVHRDPLLEQFADRYREMFHCVWLLAKNMEDPRVEIGAGDISEAHSSYAFELLKVRCKGRPCKGPKNAGASRIISPSVHFSLCSLRSQPATSSVP